MANKNTTGKKIIPFLKKIRPYVGIILFLTLILRGSKGAVVNWVPVAPKSRTSTKPQRESSAITGTGGVVSFSVESCYQETL